MGQSNTTTNNLRTKNLMVTETPASSNENVEYFCETVTITSAAAATAVTILSDARVGPGRKVYLTGFLSKVHGSTVWATTATVTVQDSSAVAFITVAVAAMTANAVIGNLTANVTLGDAYVLGSGGTAGKGLQVVGDANGTGSDYVLTVHGVIKG